MKIEWLQAYVRAVQGILLKALLWIAYFFGLGLTVLFMRIFNRKILSGRPRGSVSFWTEAKGYGREDHDVMRQS